MVWLLPSGSGNQTGLELSALSVRSGVEMSEESDQEKSGAGGAEVELGEMMVEDVESGGMESDSEDAE